LTTWNGREIGTVPTARTGDAEAEP
jgi:hypothetical protein